MIEIETVVDEFVKAQKAFTSVDVANEVKTRFSFVRNRDVAAWLRQNFDAPFYDVSPITVTLPDGSTATANLYHPDAVDPSTYQDTSQTALPPVTVTVAPTDTSYLIPQHLKDLYNTATAPAPTDTSYLIPQHLKDLYNTATAPAPVSVASKLQNLGLDMFKKFKFVKT